MYAEAEIRFVTSSKEQGRTRISPTKLELLLSGQIASVVEWIKRLPGEPNIGGSIPGRVIPKKSKKMVLVAALPGRRH